MLRPYRLERELDRAVSQWLDWLPRWEPAAVRPRGRLCARCPGWVHGLGLGDAPHGAIHALVASIDSVVAEHFHRSASARFPALTEGGLWQVVLESGVVRVLTSDGRSVEGLPLGAVPLDPASGIPLGTITAGEAAAARAELADLHGDIVVEAMTRVARQRASIALVLETVVEPKVMALAENLLEELGALG